MKKLFFALMFFSVIFFMWRLSATSKYRPASALALSVPSITASIVSTETQIPTATIDYQSTLIVAQQTADEARRVNAMVTAEFQQRAQEQLQMTAEADKRNQEIYSWTVTAAQTSIPLTATQQTIHNAQIAQQLQIEAGAMTGTKEAPTQMIAMAAAQNTIRFQKAGSIIGMFAQITVSIAVLMIAIFLFLNVPKQQIGNIVEDEMPEPSPTVTRVNLYINNGAHSEFHEIPCSSDQLSEFAEKFLNEDVTLRINNWEGSDTLWTRDVYLPFREWMVKAGLVLEDKKPNDSIQITPKQELTDFLHGWLDRGVLPSGYEFETTHSPATASTSKDAEIMDNSLMDMVSHAHDNGGGGKMVLQSELR